ncbi:gamma-glutamyltransferase [Natronorarus salvus]|uniref:gamma-glutamyltransferase n=1 Tax=Natronorarus salvus TaxID=3117733 RepID=UPI002F26C873
MRKPTLFTRGGTDPGGGLEQAYGERSEASGVGRRPLLAGAAALATGGLVTGLTAARRNSSDRFEPSVATGEEGAVSTPDPIASEVGAQVLEQGGNAIDAAVAAQLSLCATMPDATGLGGGGFMLVHDTAAGKSHAIDGQVRAPSAAGPDRFEDAGSDITESGLSVGVPGTPRTLEVALDRFGSASVPELIAPAISLSKGIRDVTSDLERTIEANADRLSPEAESTFSGLSEGDPLLQEDLAETLRILSDDGLGAFYTGAIASDIAETVQGAGGDLTTEDLAAYEATVDEPIVGRVNDCPCLVPRPPSSGITAVQSLKILASLASDHSGDSAERYHALLEATRLAYADNWTYLGDSAHDDIPVEGLLDELYLSRRRDVIAPGVVSERVEAGDPWTFQDGREEPNEERGLPSESGTTHVSVADSEGTVVSYSSTLSQPFGSGIVVPGRGISLANSLTNFDFTPGGPNSVAANKRPMSTMSPMIVLDDGAPILALGGSGGAVVPSVVAQVVHRVLEDGAGTAAAVAEPRVFAGASSTVWWESGLTEATRGELDGFGYETEAESTELGEVQALSIDGEYTAIADGRGTGDALAVPRDE